MLYNDSMMCLINFNVESQLLYVILYNMHRLKLSIINYI